MRFEFSTFLNRGLRIFGFAICTVITLVLAVQSAMSGQILAVVIFGLIAPIGFFEIRRLIVDNRKLILFDDHLEYSVVNGSNEQKEAIPYSEVREIKKYKWGAPFFIVLSNGKEIFFSYNFKLDYSSLSDEQISQVSKMGGNSHLRNIIFVKSVLQSKIGRESK